MAGDVIGHLKNVREMVALAEADLPDGYLTLEGDKCARLAEAYLNSAGSFNEKGNPFQALDDVRSAEEALELASLDKNERLQQLKESASAKAVGALLERAEKAKKSMGSAYQDLKRAENIAEYGGVDLPESFANIRESVCTAYVKELIAAAQSDCRFCDCMSIEHLKAAENCAEYAGVELPEDYASLKESVAKRAIGGAWHHVASHLVWASHDLEKLVAGAREMDLELPPELTSLSELMTREKVYGLEKRMDELYRVEE